MRLRGRVARNALRGWRGQSVLKLAVVCATGAAFWAGILAASAAGFRFIEMFLGGAELLSETLLALFFLLLGVMLLFSNAIISFGSLFRSDETDLLLSWPVEAESIFTYKLAESVAFSSWAFLVLGFPLVLGYGLSVRAPWYYPGVILAYFAPFVLLAATGGALVAQAVAAWMPERAKRLLGLSAAGTIAVALSVALWVHGAVGRSAAFTELDLQRVLDRTDFARNMFLPSYWMAKGLLHGARGGVAEAGYYWLVLASNAALGLLACWAFGRRFLRIGWSRSRSKAGGRTPLRGDAWARVRWAPATRLLMSKDWLLFVRDPVQWSQCAILFGLMGFYVVNLRTFSYHLSPGMWRNLTALLNLAATSLVLATVTTRFIYPLLSLEGRRFWLLGLAPVPRRTLLWSKFAFSFAAALAITLPLVIASDLMLRLPPGTIWHHGVAMALVCFGVTGLSVGLGALFPNLREENPSKVVSGFGGTLNLLLSVAFVAVVAGLTAVPYAARIVRLGREGPETLYALAASGLVAALTGLIPMHCGLRALKRMEF